MQTVEVNGRIIELPDVGGIILVHVNEECARKGRPISMSECPLALAVEKRFGPGVEVRAFPSHVEIFDIAGKSLAVFDCSERLEGEVTRFDGGGVFRPARYRLTRTE